MQKKDVFQRPNKFTFIKLYKVFIQILRKVNLLLILV